MTKRHEVEHHLQTLNEIRHIMGSMKTLALLETHKLIRFLATQEQALHNILRMAADFRSFFPITPAPVPDTRDVYLLLGSERGFCGDFNEALLSTLNEQLQQDGVSDPMVIGVGRKLCIRLEDDARLVSCFDGANVVEEVENVLAHLADELGRMQSQYGPFRLTVIHHATETGTVLAEQILPPFPQTTPSARFSHAPLLQLEPETLFTDILEQYLFAELYFLIYISLMAESRRRMQHLEGAINRLDEQVAGLLLTRNALRQEEVTEEIEAILLSATAVQQE